MAIWQPTMTKLWNMTWAQIVEDSTPTDITRNSLSFKSSTSPAVASSVHDAEYEADLDVMDEMNKLLRDLDGTGSTV